LIQEKSVTKYQQKKKMFAVRLSFDKGEITTDIPWHFGYANTTVKKYSEIKTTVDEIMLAPPPATGDSQASALRNSQIPTIIEPG
jgi:hypothetical protein